MTLGEKIRYLRLQRHWTLATLCQRTGISMSHLSAIEKGGRKNPSFDVVCRIAHAFDLPLSYFDSHNEREEKMTTVNYPLLVSEEGARYLQLAEHLAERKALDNTSLLLESIAEFLNDNQATYLPEDSHSTDD
ncbi:helix-turn-helix domain-containing protein [Alicyclobacillus tolerans]|uniref:Transcriptional regulator, contains XRE-family HTH domain n=1 Tax=Alicyclobacillus tolerans TaxID=90970 RepID=A0A1M6WEI9_9BACL|nr:MULTISPECIES: helix-turn-helix transcriptional regulator [Alicyclobacillus]SHK91885.1 Transcriptional regulator, contains XRE-family HTH domain [Alicyclobacillus montanus]